MRSNTTHPGLFIYNAVESNYQAILDAATGKEVGLCPSNTRGCMVSGATKTVLQGGPLHPFNVVRVFDFTRKEIARLVVLLPTFGQHADDARDPEILVIDTTTGAVDRRMYSGPWALPSLDFDAAGSRMLVAGAMNLNFWRTSREWRQSEQQIPIPRKVVDTLKILEEEQAKKAAASGAAPASAPKSTGT